MWLLQQVSIEPKVANRVVAEFIKKKPGSLANYRDVALTEGVTEALTSFSQDLSDTYFLENKPTWDQIGKNMMESFGAGVLMGVGVGSLSFKSQDLATKRRREAQDRKRGLARDRQPGGWQFS